MPVLVLQQVGDDLAAPLGDILVIIAILSLMADDVPEIILDEGGHVLGSDIPHLEVDGVLAFEREPDGIGWIRIVAHTTHTATEAEVSPRSIGTDIRAPVHLQFEVGDGIKVEVTVQQPLRDSVDGALRHADTETAGVGTGAGGETRDNGRLIDLIHADLLEEAVDVRQISLSDVTHLNLLLLREADDIVTVVVEIVGDLCEKLGRAIAVRDGDISIPQTIGLLMGIAPFPGLERLVGVLNGCERRVVMVGCHDRCRRMEVERRIVLQGIKLIHIHPLSLLFPIAVEDITHARLMPVTAVAVLIEPVLQRLGSAIKIFLRQEVEDLETGGRVRSRTAGNEHTETTLTRHDTRLQA